MKKLLLLISLVSINFTVFAQDDANTQEEKPAVNTNYFGIKAGVNYSTVKAEGIETTDNLIGPNVGLFFESRQTERFSFLLEANYSTKGGSLKDTLGTYDFKANYLDIPLMVAFYPIKGLSIQAGMQPSIVLSGSQTANFTTPDTSIVYEFPVKDLSTGARNSYFPIYFGFVAGINYKITEAISVDLKYNPVGRFDGQKKLSVFTFRVGYAFIKN